jgi:hypothetical protein
MPTLVDRINASAELATVPLLSTEACAVPGSDPALSAVIATGQSFGDGTALITAACLTGHKPL